MVITLLNSVYKKCLILYIILRLSYINLLKKLNFITLISISNTLVSFNILDSDQHEHLSYNNYS